MNASQACTDCSASFSSCCSSRTPAGGRGRSGPISRPPPRARTGCEAALADGDQRAADRELATLRDRSASAADHTGGPLWSLLVATPVLGDDAAAVRTTSQVLDALSRDGLTPLVRSSAKLDAGAFAPHDGSLPVEAISALAQPVGDGLEAFTAADKVLAAVDTEGLISPVRRRFEDFAQVVQRGFRDPRNGRQGGAAASFDARCRGRPPLPVDLPEQCGGSAPPAGCPERCRSSTPTRAGSG